MPLGHEIATLTSLGTGTAKTRLNGDKAVKLAEGARTLVGIKPYLFVETVTAAEPTIAKIEVESDDVQLKPYEILANVVGSSLGKLGITVGSMTEFWPIFAKLKGGESINIYGTALNANTSAPFAGCMAIISDEPLWAIEKQKKAKMGTLTSTGTAAAEVNGTPYSITGVRKLREVFGAVVPTTVAASKGFTGYFKYVSSEFEPPFPKKYPLPPIHAALSTDATTASNANPITQIMRERDDIVMKPSQTTIADYFNLERSVTTAGKFVSGIIAE